MRPRLKNAADIRSRIEKSSSPLDDNSNCIERMEEGSTEPEPSNSVSPSIDDSLFPSVETPPPVKQTRTRNIKKPVRFGEDQNYASRSPSSEREASLGYSTSNDDEEEEEDDDDDEESPPGSSRVGRKGPLPSEGGNEVCRACQAAFRSKCALNVHVKKAHKDDPGPFFDCDQCDKKYRTYAPLNHHKLAKHGGKVKSGIGKKTKGPFEHCPICDAPFKGKTRLDLHIYIEHKDSAVRPFECEFCGRTFRRLQMLCDHRNQHLSGEGNPHACGYECGLRFENWDGVRRHEYKVHGVVSDATRATQPADLYACPHCGKQCTNSRTRYDHIQSAHKETMTYKCEVCFIPFMNSGALASHMRHTHADTSNRDPLEYPFHCDLCNMRYKDYNRLVMHQRKFHGGETDAALSQHIARKRSFFCPICVSSYKDDCTIFDHIALVHADFEGDLFICDICNVVFTEIKPLERHKRSAHKIYPEKKSSSKKERASQFDNWAPEMCKEEEKEEKAAEHGRPTGEGATPLDTPLFDNALGGEEVKPKEGEIAELVTDRMQESHDGVTHVLHKQRDANAKRGFTCPICKLYSDDRTLFDHIARRHPYFRGALHFCEVCNEGFTEVKYLNKHKYQAHKICLNGPCPNEPRGPRGPSKKRSIEAREERGEQEKLPLPVAHRNPLDLRSPVLVRLKPLETPSLFDNAQRGEEKKPDREAVEEQAGNPEEVKEESGEEWEPDPVADRMQEEYRALRKWSYLEEDHCYAMPPPMSLDEWLRDVRLRRALEEGR